MQRNGLESALVFTLMGCSFAAELKFIKETVQLLPITRVPRLPDWLSGIVNLRGNIIPIADLALFFNGEASSAPTPYSCIVVLTCGDYTLGVLAENVLRLYGTKENHLNEGLFRARRGFEKYVKKEFSDNGKVIFLLDVEKIFRELSGDEESAEKEK